MSEFKFVDHSEEVKGLLGANVEAALEEACGELEAQVKRNTKVKTGKTKNSWQHRVTGDAASGKFAGNVGSDYENAIWEEFGTGEYALNGNGRKGGWFYVDEKGDGHFTHGKHPRRPFHNAYTTLKNKMIKIIQDRIKGGLS